MRGMILNKNRSHYLTNGLLTKSRVEKADNKRPGCSKVG